MNYYKIAPLRLNLPALIYKSPLALPKNSIVKIRIKNKNALGIVLDSAKKPDFECEWAMQSEFYLTPSQAVMGKFIASYYCVNEGVAFSIFTLGNSSLTQDTRIALANNLDSADSQNLVKKPCHSNSFSCHSERSEESKRNPSLRADSQNLRGNPQVEKSAELQSGLPRSHSLAHNDEILDSSLRLRSAQNDNFGLDSADFPLNSTLSTQEANSSIFDEKSGFCETSDADKTNGLSRKRVEAIPNLSQKDAEFALSQNLPRLSPTQQHALDFILSHDKTLLFGDTGSGKTEIYINAIARTIAQGKNVIFLMPEISLTPQMERRLKGVFGDLVCIWHSKITKAKKEQILSRLDSAPYHKNAESASFCHSERSEESKKNNLVILSKAKYLNNNNRDSSVVSLPQNDNLDLDSSLRKCSAQNDNMGAENYKNSVRVAESALDSANNKESAQFSVDSAYSTNEANSVIADEFLGLCEASDKDRTKVHRGSEPMHSLKSRCESKFAPDSAKTPIKIIAGARSALFLPLFNIGLIIIDEEHDDAYKSNSSPRYNARDLAIFLAHKERVRLILGSATPSVNSYYNFSKENCVFRLRGGYFQGKKSVSFDSEILSPNLLEKIRTALENKAQSIIFVPLRGNFKVLQCESCGNGAKCKHCSINMSLHSKKNALICHYCGYAEPFFDGKTKCKICNSSAFKALKIGTQEICKQLQSHFTHAKIAIFDRDEVKSDSKMRKILGEFNDGKIDILVGTQMISKGHDYHNVALVAILGIDGILNSSDFRAYERAVGLLTQISGRTARKNDGEVVINTRNRAFFAPFLNDYEEFLHFELKNRENLYPPFRRIALLIAQNRDESKAKEILQNAKKIVESANKNIEIIGLNKAPIERINGLWRYFMLLRARSAKELVCAVSSCKNLPLIIDIDPQQVF